VVPEITTLPQCTQSFEYHGVYNSELTIINFRHLPDQTTEKHMKLRPDLAHGEVDADGDLE
jgi:hypothetical protein